MHLQLLETFQHPFYHSSHILFWEQVFLLIMLVKSKPIFYFTINTYKLQLFINETEYSFFVLSRAANLHRNLLFMLLSSDTHTKYIWTLFFIVLHGEHRVCKKNSDLWRRKSPDNCSMLTKLKAQDVSEWRGLQGKDMRHTENLTRHCRLPGAAATGVRIIKK